MPDPTMDDVVNMVKEIEDEGQKIHTLLALMNTDQVLAELKKEAMMIKIGMTLPTALTSFAYTILKAMKPELFDTEQEEG